MEELTLRSNIQPAVMLFNMQEIKKNLEARLEDYTKIVVTEDTLPSCKNASRELASFRNRLDEFRKTQKKEAEKPIRAFEKEVNDLIDQVKKAEKPLNEALDVYAEKERQKKRDFAKNNFQEAAEQAGLRPEYCAMFVNKKEFTNVNTTLKSIREDVQSQVEALKQKQEEHDRNVSLVRETVDTENGRIQVKLNPEEFLEEFEQTDDILGIIRKIKNRAEDIFQQEKKLEEERLERERREKERLEREQAEKERQEREREERKRRAAEEAAAKAEAEAEAAELDPADAMVIPPELMDPAMDTAVNDEDAPATHPASISAASAIPASVPGTVYSTPSPEVAMPFETNEPIYEVTFRVAGGFGVLRELNTYLKNNNISYEVLNQIKK